MGYVLSVTFPPPSRRRLDDVMVAPSKSEFAAGGKLTVLGLLR
jgi:hypothetical protein